MSNPSVTLAPLAGDGGVRNEQTIATTWPTVRSASSGDSAWPTGANDYACYAGALGGYYKLIRGYFPFDLTGQLPAGAVITAVTLRLWCVAKASGAGGSIGIVASTQASNTTLATSDFSQVGSTEYATRVNFSTPTTGAYNDFPLNATGIAAANAALGGVFKLALRSSRDLDNSAPTAATESYFQAYFSEQTGSANDPQLVVEYSLVRTGGDTLTLTDGTTGIDLTHAGVTTRKRYPYNAVAFTDGASPYWRSQRVPVLVWAEGYNSQLNDAAGVSASAGTFTVDSTSGAPSSGTFVISYLWDQAEIAYTGKTGTTFTGCTVVSGSGTFPDNSLIMARDAETHFPQITPLSDDPKPELMITAVQKPGHGGSIGGRLVGKRSVDGGKLWGTQFVITNFVNTSGYTGGGHTVVRLKTGRLIIMWYEGQIGTGSAGLVKSYIAYSDDNFATLSTPVQLTSPFHANVCAVGFDSVLFTGAGSNSTYGDVYVTCYGNDSASYDNTVTYNKVMKITDGGAAGTWTTVGTINTLAQLGGRASEEASLTFLDTGMWISTMRVETLGADGLDRFQAAGGADASTWTGHVKIVDDLANCAVTHQMPEGHLITQGMEVRSSGRGVAGSTITFVSIDRGATTPWPTAQWRQEENDATYVNYNGSDFATLADTTVPYRRVVNAYSQERLNQAGAQVKFQWYALPNFPLTFDAIAFTDAGVRSPQAFSRTGADGLAFTDTGVKGAVTSRTGTDALSFIDTATRGATTRSRAGTDSLAFTDTATRSLTSSTSSSRTASDALAFTDTAGRILALAGSTLTLPLTANFISARSQTANFISARSQTADFVPGPA